MAGQWDESADFVIVGSGGGSFVAALVVQELGKKPIIIEKQDKVGGSTGYSGGVLWVPNNPLMAREGIPDSYERARLYMDSVIGDVGAGSTPARREAFLKAGPEMVSFLEAKGMKFKRPEGWADYYDDRPGGEPRSRSLVAPLFDINELGEWKNKLSMYKGPPLPMGSEDYSELFMLKRNFKGKLMAMRLAWRMVSQKLTGKDYRGSGAALQGRMLQVALRHKIPIWTETPVEDFVVENGRVAGVVVKRGSDVIRVQARDGVLINVGGFSRNAEMRRKYQPQPSSDIWTNANPGDTGEIIEAAMNLGAAVDCMNEAWWVVTSLGPNESFPEGAVAADGTPIPFMHHMDLSYPHLILVDQDGQRYCNEAGSYMEIGQRMYKRHQETGRAVPSWAILESRHRENYIWGNALPGKTPRQWFDSGYMKRADSIEDLARQCGIDAAGLAKTIERYNGFCKAGVDQDYNKGGRAFDRYHGDPTIKPNPNLGGFEKAPYYAVAIYPGDVGTAGGVMTDEYARVLKADGAVIPGLYATGNSTASVMGRSYIGAGASIGPSYTFGYIAAKHAAGASAA